jgi:hypothetical protein
MSNNNGKKYGFTALFPIKGDAECASLRRYLRDMDSHPRGSPLSSVPIIHMTRLVIIDELPFQGQPATLDKLESCYLLIACDFDGDDPEQLVTALASAVPAMVTDIWSHCLGFPGVTSGAALIAYFKRCQLMNNLLLADQPDMSVGQILTALLCKRRFSEFLRQHQANDPARLQQEFQTMWQALIAQPAVEPGSI